MLYAPGCAVARSKAIRLMVSGLSAYWHQRVLRLALILSDLRSEFVKFGAVIVDVAFK